MKKLLLLIIIAASFVSCKKSSSPPATPSTPKVVMGTNSITFINGGCSYNNNTYVVDSFLYSPYIVGNYSGTHGTKDTTSNYFMVTQQNWLYSNSHSPWISITFAFPCKTGTYKVTDTTMYKCFSNWCAGIAIKDSLHNCGSGEYVYQTWNPGDTAAYLVINVTKFGNVGQLVEGTYSGSLYTPTPMHVRVTGKFSVIRGGDQ